jgi:signal transduction histidine kinase
MSTAEWIRRVCATKWLRLAAVCVSAALVVTTLVAILGRTSSVPVTLQRALIHAFIMGGLAGTVMPRIAGRLRTARAPARWSLIVPTLLGLAPVGTALACVAIRVLGLDQGEPLLGCFLSDLPINAILTMTIGTGMLLYESQRARLEEARLELQTAALEQERARKTALEARLASLEARLQPHFLFNTLNAISALVQEDPDRAERTVEQLAALLRFSLDATERGMVPLAHELKIVADYLEIERTRLGERLAFALDVHPDVTQCGIPPLAVQTLVENSVTHAIAPRPGGGRLRVEAGAAGERLVLTVWDDGPGFTAAAIRPGHGLDNLRQRLAARFGDAATLEVEAHDGGTRVRVALPRAGIH